MPDDLKLRLKELAGHLPEFAGQAVSGEVRFETLAALRGAWGNPFTPPPELLLEGCRRALLSASGVLECGSGLTTVLLTVICEARKIPFAALEHDANWFEIARTALSYLGISGGHLRHAPLKEFGEFAWYDCRTAVLPPSFDFVLCDGPPGSTHGGRYGLLPIMASRLAPGCVVLLDDADREGEQAVLKRWNERFAVDIEFRGGPPHRFATVKLSGPQ